MVGIVRGILFLKYKQKKNHNTFILYLGIFVDLLLFLCVTHTLHNAFFKKLQIIFYFQKV